MKDVINVMYYMRKRMNVTQKQISKSTGLTANDISRLERGIKSHRIEKFVTLSQYLNIPVESLLYNNLKMALITFKEPVKISRKTQELKKNLQQRRDDIGFQGENWVFEKEVEKLKGTCYALGVNPNYADDEEAHFDILSFSRNGENIKIEVKTTCGDEDEPFFVTVDELSLAKECLNNGIRYEVHRVHNIFNATMCGRTIIPADQLLKDYDFIPINYKVVRKESKIS